MGFLRHKLLNLLAVIVMLITLLPVGLAHADSSQQSLYFNFTDFSTTQSDPTQVNTSTVSLNGTFNGVSGATLSYQVEQLVNNQSVNTSKSTGVAAIITNGNTFSFQNVQLYQGLNRITIFGTDPNGEQVSGVCYVQFSDVPVIYDVTLVDGTPLQAGTPVIVSQANTVITLKAPNADQVTVNGVLAYASGQGSFIVSGLNLTPGLNDLAIVATNATQSYSLDRQLVYFDGYPTGYDTQVIGGSSPVSLEGDPTVGPTVAGALYGQVSGKMVFTSDPTVTLPPTIYVKITDQNGNLITDGTGATEPVGGFPATVDPNSTSDGSHITYSYTTNANINITQNGNYTLTILGTYGSGQQPTYQMPFTYRNSNTPYITSVNQVYSPTVIDPTNKIITYTSSTSFPNNSQLFELPIWLVVKASNYGANSTVSLVSKQDGQTVSSSVFTYNQYKTSDGDLAFEITNMPSGDQDLEITVTDSVSGNGDTKTIPVNYIPAPYIQLNNLYNTEVFNTNGTYPADANNTKAFSHIQGRLINFNTTAGSPDLGSVNLTINGKTIPLDTPADLVGNSIDAQGNFDFIIPSDMQLVGGPNTIVISGTANGVPIKTTLTVYLFSSQVPVITNLVPVPTGQMNDQNLDFKPTGTNAYSTTDKTMDDLFTVQNADTVIVYVNGSQIVKASKDPNTGTLVSDNPNVLEVLPTSDVSSQTFDFDFLNDQLPESGLQTVVVQASLGTQTVSQTLSVTREHLPYIIKSPKLPDESVINQNFVDVEIEADGADQVLIGKTPAVKDASDNFRLEVNNLKPGINKIKFTVVTGSTTLPGEIDVDYAGTSTQGAQYKTTIPNGGTVSVFNGDVSLKIPKATMLRQANQTPGQDPKTINMFDSQQVLFGIADRTDGRTIKQTNVDGTLTPVQSTPFGIDMLHVPSHFDFASNLYWIDAGYFDASSPNYDPVDGIQPYQSGMPFYTRSDQWMELTQRGTITLHYDPSIVNQEATKLSIWRLNNNTWQNMGGVVNTSKHTVSTAFDGFGYYAVFEDAYSFSDIIGHPYARDSLELMFSKGVMQPKDNNDFGVYDSMTRGEFATMLVKALDLPLQYDPNNLTFDDVPPVSVPGALWDYRYIETAARAGIVSGLQPRVFNPNGYLTREQAATMLARAMNLKLGTPDVDITALQKSFTDANTIDYYARSSVLACVKAKLITGLPNQLLQGQKKVTYRFDPTAYLNRADASIIAQRMMTIMKLL